MRKFSNGHNDGEIRYRDFLRFVAPEDEVTAEEVADKFRGMLHRVKDLRGAFKHFKRNRKGNISRRSLKEGMEKLHFNLDDSEIRVLMDILDENGDDEISYDEFVDFAQQGSGKRNSDRPPKQGDSIFFTITELKL